MSVVSRSLVALVIAAAAGAAVVAHGTIDVIADFLVAHASYDDVASHDSRGLVVIIAATVAGMVALHGLRLCCDAAANRALASSPRPSWKTAPFFACATMLLASVLVPAMELFDARLAGKTLTGLGDAFGGSVLLGLGTTLACAGAIAVAVFAFARWILSYRNRIIAAIVGFIRSRSQSRTRPHRSRTFAEAPICPRRLSALRRGKRAPPRHALRYCTPSHSHCEGRHASCTHCRVLHDRRHDSRAERRTHCSGFTNVARTGHGHGHQRPAREILGIGPSGTVRSHGRCRRLLSDHR